ncbi:MAG: hypothetical protein ABIT76_12310 [Chthoniobacterales bacterium]
MSDWGSVASRLTAGNGYPGGVVGSANSLSPTKGASGLQIGSTQAGAELGRLPTKEDIGGVGFQRIATDGGQPDPRGGVSANRPASDIPDSGKRRYTLRRGLHSGLEIKLTPQGVRKALPAPPRAFTYHAQPKRDAAAAQGEKYGVSASSALVGHGVAGEADALPCLFRNNCTDSIGEPVRKLTGAERKRAHTCMENAQHFINHYGLENCGFLTITHAEDGPIGFGEFQRRLHSAMTHFLRPAFDDYMGALEFAKREHLHFIVACGTDIRTGFDFDHYHETMIWQKSGRKGPKPVGNLNRCEWLKEMHASLCDRLPDYGLGRAELVPIWKSAEAVGYYLGGYLSKSIPNRLPEHKGARFMRYSKTAPRIVKGSFAWLGVHSWLWRQKLATFAAHHDCKDEADLKSIFGTHWAYHMRAAILATDLSWYLTGHHAKADGRGDENMDLDAPYYPPARPMTGREVRKMLNDIEIKKIVEAHPVHLRETRESPGYQQAIAEWESYNRPF